MIRKMTEQKMERKLFRIGVAVVSAVSAAVLFIRYKIANGKLELINRCIKYK